MLRDLREVVPASSKYLCHDISSRCAETSILHAITIWLSNLLIDPSRSATLLSHAFSGAQQFLNDSLILTFLVLAVDYGQEYWNLLPRPADPVFDRYCDCTLERRVQNNLLVQHVVVRYHTVIIEADSKINAVLSSS